MQLGVDILIENHFRTLDLSVPAGDGTTIEPIFMGADVDLVSDTRVIVETVFGIMFFVIAVMAWRGRPAWSRYVMLAAVLGLTFLTTLFTVLPLFQSTGIGGGVDSGEPVVMSLLCGRLALTVLIPLYVVWYMNRAPARAFYRGYYLQENG